MPDVSVVIPSTGRSTLPSAVRSARQQACTVEIIVVFDLPQGEAPLELARGADIVIVTGGVGGGGARNAGVTAATGDWVGFLDDDDEWLPDKCAVQLRAARASGAHVVASRVRQTFSADVADATGPAIPSATYAGGSVAHYLFRRRRAGSGRASLYTSCLLVQRSLAADIPWDPTLRRHQDWDWLVRAVDTHSARLVQVPEVCAVIRTGSQGSVSRSADWESSLTWARRILGPGDRGTFVDFVAAQPLRYALTARSWAGACRCLRTVAMAGRAPSMSTVLVGLAGLLPRSAFTSLYRVVR